MEIQYPQEVITNNNSMCSGSVNEVSHPEKSNQEKEVIECSDEYYAKELENDERLFTNRELTDIVDGCLRFAVLGKGEKIKGAMDTNINDDLNLRQEEDKN